MNRYLFGMALAAACVPAVACHAAPLAFTCDTQKPDGVLSADLAGLWDVLMAVEDFPNFGLLSLGKVGEGFGGSLSLSAGVVVVTSLEVNGDGVTMVVASGEGDVRFDGSLAGDGKRMCGTVSYHGGRKFEMIVQKRADRSRGRGG